MIQPPNGDKALEKQASEGRITQAKAKEIARAVRAMLKEEEKGVRRLLYHMIQSLLADVSPDEPELEAKACGWNSECMWVN
ncbi:unnamed protein product [Cochlearia groenlandica]